LCSRRAAAHYVGLDKRVVACDRFLISIGEDHYREDLFAPDDERKGLYEGLKPVAHRVNALVVL
jgi:hypothetical protein